MHIEQCLVWNPLIKAYEAGIGHGTYLIAPFIQYDALRQLLESVDPSEDLQVITRWNPSDLVSGVSDVAVYDLLKARGVRLFIHDSIHLKMLVCNDGMAFQSSGNITKKGLGISNNGNVELGAWCAMTADDYQKLYVLMDECTPVSEEMYQQAKDYIEEHKEVTPPLPQIKWKREPKVNEFSRQALPFSQSPGLLWEYYDNKYDAADKTVAFNNDLAKYGITTNGLNREQFMEVLTANFQREPFVIAFVEYLKQHGDLRFGKANKWLLDYCSDRPIPTSWEMKPVLNRLYDWLAELYDEITWNVPGSHSQVIYWEK
jgi:hypothetical protein